MAMGMTHAQDNDHDHDQYHDHDDGDGDGDSDDDFAAALSTLSLGVVPADAPVSVGPNVVPGAAAFAHLVSAFGAGGGPARAYAKAPLPAATVTRFGVRYFEAAVGVLVDTAARSAVIVDHKRPGAGAIRVDGVPALCIHKLPHRIPQRGKAWRGQFVQYQISRHAGRERAQTTP
jgi:hypothetical protein